MNKRLLKCADFIQTKGNVADIGTDHGYLSIHLVKSGRCAYAYACDINKAPLAGAQKNITAQGLDENITTILSDGLKNVPYYNVTDVVIAGMGGELICNILNDCLWIKQNINLILQPMTKAEVLRVWLYDNGFEIINEEAVSDDGFDYAVINCRYCGKTEHIDMLRSYVGEIKPTGEDNISYMRLIEKRLRAIAAGLESSTYSKDKALVYKNTADRIKSIMEE